MGSGNLKITIFDIFIYFFNNMHGQGGGGGGQRSSSGGGARKSPSRSTGKGRTRGADEGGGRSQRRTCLTTPESAPPTMRHCAPAAQAMLPKNASSGNALLLGGPKKLAIYSNVHAHDADVLGES